MTTLKLLDLLMVVFKKFKIRQLIWRLQNTFLFTAHLPRIPAVSCEHETLSGLSMCTSECFYKLSIAVSIVNPEYLPEFQSSFQIRGTGTALKQSIINFLESSTEFRLLESYPVDEVSAYLNHKLGFTMMG